MSQQHQTPFEKLTSAYLQAKFVEEHFPYVVSGSITKQLYCRSPLKLYEAVNCFYSLLNVLCLASC